MKAAYQKWIEKIMDWEAQVALDRYRERLAEAQCNYDLQEALHVDRRGTDAPSRLLRFTGRMLVGLGKRLQRWGGWPASTPHTETR